MGKVRAKPIRVNTTARDIREGKAGDCFQCAFARAVQRATKDDHANVYERDYITYIEAWSRHIVAPVEVRAFVWDFDHGLDRNPDKTVILPTLRETDVKPFKIVLPPQDDPAWQERCYSCEELFAGPELDDEGNCPECRDK